MQQKMTWPHDIGHMGPTSVIRFGSRWPRVTIEVPWRGARVTQKPAVIHRRLALSLLALLHTGTKLGKRSDQIAVFPIGSPHAPGVCCAPTRLTLTPLYVGYWLADSTRHRRIGSEGD